MKKSRIHRRIYELLSKAAIAGSSQPSSGQRELHFVFFHQPDRFLESCDEKGYVSGVHLEKTALKGILISLALSQNFCSTSALYFSHIKICELSIERSSTWIS